MIPTDCLDFRVIPLTGKVDDPRGYQGVAVFDDGERQLTLHAPPRPTQHAAWDALIACLEGREVWVEHGDTIAGGLEAVARAQIPFCGAPLTDDPEDLLLDLVDGATDSVLVKEDLFRIRCGKQVGRVRRPVADLVVAETLLDDLSSRGAKYCKAARAYAAIMSDPRAVAAQRSAPMRLLRDQLEETAPLLWTRSIQLSSDWFTSVAAGGRISEVRVLYPDGCPTDVIEDEARAFASDPVRVARFLAMQGISDRLTELPGLMRRWPAPARRFPEWVRDAPIT